MNINIMFIIIIKKSYWTKYNYKFKYLIIIIITKNSYWPQM